LGPFSVHFAKMSYEPHQKTPLDSKPYFDDNAERYRLCCCHVRIWALIIGVLELIGMLLNLASSISGYVKGDRYTTNKDADYSTGTSLAGLIGGIIGFVIGLVVVILFIYGIVKERYKLLIPHIVMQVIGIICLVIAAIAYFVIAGIAGARRNGGTAAGIIAGSGGAMILAAIFEIFFLYVSIRTYRYLKDKHLANEAAAYVPMGSSYSAVEKGI